MPDADPPLEESVRIDAPPADVWAVVSDLPRPMELPPRARRRRSQSGTLLAERRELPDGKSLLGKAFGAVFLGGNIDHDQELRAGMRTTLARIKGTVEAGHVGGSTMGSGG
jgi:hypothetical protein